MTDEDKLQCKMEFIVEQQAHITASLQQFEEHWKRVEEERIRDQPRLAAFHESFVQLVELTRP